MASTPNTLTTLAPGNPRRTAAAARALAPPARGAYDSAMRLARPRLSPAVIVATLALIAACDKTPAVDPNQVLPAGATPLDLASKPQILFQVFGDVSDPKIMPIAAVVGGAIQQIGLTRQGWRELDSIYFAAGSTYPVYIANAQRGTVKVTRGMWGGEETEFYPLPGCRDLRPLGGASIQVERRSNEPTVELIATALPVGPKAMQGNQFPASATIARMGREMGHALGLANEMDRDELDSLDFIARMIATGARRDPTLLVSFIDQQAGDIAPGVGHTSHILALFDKVDTGYVPTYRHVKSGDAKGVEFQRVLDHMDVDGDGIDEIIVESWHYAGTNELVVLNFKAGQWHEALRASSRWCLDPPKPDKK